MIGRFFGKRSMPSYSVPSGTRVYAIGDIHGRLDLFDDLLTQIYGDEAKRGVRNTTIVLLGDLIDRGSDSAGVIDRVLSLRQERTLRVLLGNHEEMFQRVLAGDAAMLRPFMRAGRRETIFSYGVSLSEYRTLDASGLIERIQTNVPPQHKAFLAACEDMIEIGEYVFVHAGIRPNIPLNEQQPSDLRWIRNDFLADRSDHGRLIVHGHTITREPETRPNRIGIDTGAYVSGRLTAIGLEGTAQWFLTTDVR